MAVLPRSFLIRKSEQEASRGLGCRMRLNKAMDLLMSNHMEQLLPTMPRLQTWEWSLPRPLILMTLGSFGEFDLLLILLYLFQYFLVFVLSDSRVYLYFCNLLPVVFFYVPITSL
jgi:hypothetical protein